MMTKMSNARLILTQKCLDKNSELLLALKNQFYVLATENRITINKRIDEFLFINCKLLKNLKTCWYAMTKMNNSCLIFI